jgi:DNA-binding XRE family transcriptional regulator
MTFEQAINAGIRRGDIMWDLERRFVHIDQELPSRMSRSRVAAGRLNLYNRTAGEELWIWRSRRLSPTGRPRSRVGSGMSQKEAAAELGISIQRYNDAENDRLPERDVRYILTTARTSDHPPSLPEMLALARRRCGMILEKICAELTISRQAYLKREHAGDQRLITYWQKQGYIL